MADYSKWEAMARAEEEAERREKEEKRAANRDKYYKEQEEKKAKYMQDQEAKKKVERETANEWAEGGSGGRINAGGAASLAADGGAELMHAHSLFIYHCVFHQ